MLDLPCKLQSLSEVNVLMLIQPTNPEEYQVTITAILEILKLVTFKTSRKSFYKVFVYKLHTKALLKIRG